MIKKGTRVYIDAKKGERGQWLAISSPTAVTVRRLGTVTKVGKVRFHIAFDDAPFMTSEIWKAYVRLAPAASKLAMEHAEWASDAVDAFLRKSTLRLNDGQEETVACLLAGLAHLCERDGLDFDGLVERAKAMYGWNREAEAEG